MKRHVAAVVALITSLLVIDSHVDWVRQDGRPLLAVNGQHWDLHGWAAEQLLQLRRDCTPVNTWPSDSPTGRAILSEIQQHSLPDSQSAHALQLLQLDDWGVAEVDFETLKPSLVVLRLQAGQWRVQDQAVWSGSTSPWQSGDFVRRYLQQQAPELPQALLACVSVDPARYGYGPDKRVPAAPPAARP